MCQSPRKVEGLRGNRDSVPCAKVFHEEDVTGGVVDNLHGGVETL